MSVGATENEGQGSDSGVEVSPVAAATAMLSGGDGNNEAIANSEPIEPQGGGDSLNPAWNDLLQKIPSTLHSQITPDLTKWDQNFQSKISEVHSQYAPYKEYIEKQVAPDQINYALNVLEAINQRPLEVIEALQKYAQENGLIQNQQPGQEQQGQVDVSEIPAEFLEHPEIKKMQQALNLITDYFVQQKQAEEEQQSDQQLQEELASLKTEMGDFDEDWVLTKAMQAAQTGVQVTSLKPYVEAYKQFTSQLLANANRPGPKVVAPSGGIAPDSKVDLSKLSDKERRALVVQSLQGANQTQ